MFVNGKETFKFKVYYKNANFSTQFCHWSMYKVFSVTESREASFNENMYDVSVDYSSIYKSDVFKHSQVFNVKK